MAMVLMLHIEAERLLVLKKLARIVAGLKSLEKKVPNVELLKNKKMMYGKKKMGKKKPMKKKKKKMSKKK